MRKIFFTALVGAMMISCSRDNDDTGSVTNDTSILPTKFTHSRTSGEDIVYTFSYNGNKLVKITSGFYDEIFTYTGDLITSVRSNYGYLEFGYDANGNLISEKLMNESGNKSVDDITYTINGSTVTAQRIYKAYNNFDGMLYYTITSNITYTLDEKKRPIKKVEVYESKDLVRNITDKGTDTYTFQYPNHHGFSENIKGMDKLSYSSFAIGFKSSFDLDHPIIYLPFSYFKKEMNAIIYSSNGSYLHGGGTDEAKTEYVVNAHNYPTGIEYKVKTLTGEFKNLFNNSYYTIEYNK